MSSIRALAVHEWGKAPTSTSISLPDPTSTQTRVTMIASGFANLVRSQASGTHYSVPKSALPYVPGVDGVGRTPDNKLVFVTTMSSSPAGGTFAEQANIDNNVIVPLPTEANKDSAIKVAALLNPAMSGWMALQYRAHISTLQEYNVLILGATSVSGRIAALFARRLGAKHIIGAARNATDLQALKDRGILDHTITLANTVSETDFSLLSSGQDGTFPHVVLDYIWGPTATALLNALPKSARNAEQYEVRYVHIGTLGKEADVNVPGPLLRSKNVTINGSGPGAWSLKVLGKELPRIVEAILADLPQEKWREEYGVTERSLDQGEEAWADVKGRTVLVMAWEK